MHASFPRCYPHGVKRLSRHGSESALSAGSSAVNKRVSAYANDPACNGFSCLSTQWGITESGESLRIPTDKRNSPAERKKSQKWREGKRETPNGGKIDGILGSQVRVSTCAFLKPPSSCEE